MTPMQAHRYTTQLRYSWRGGDAGESRKTVCVYRFCDRRRRLLLDGVLISPAREGGWPIYITYSVKRGYPFRFFLHGVMYGTCPTSPQCGAPLQTIEHVIMQCPLFTAARLKHLTFNGHTRSFQQLLETPKRVQELLRFLEETRACNKPRAVWEPD
jgi:hypothetical protein